MDSSADRNSRNRNNDDGESGSPHTDEQIKALYPVVRDDGGGDAGRSLANELPRHEVRRNFAAGDGSEGMQRRSHSREGVQVVGITPQASRASLDSSSSEGRKSPATSLTPGALSRPNIRSRTSTDVVDFRTSRINESSYPGDERMPRFIPEAEKSAAKKLVHQRQRSQKQHLHKLDSRSLLHWLSSRRVWARAHPYLTALIIFLGTITVLLITESLLLMQAMSVLAPYVSRFYVGENTGQKSPISGGEKRLDNLYKAIVSMVPSAASSNVVFRDQLGEVAAQLVDQLSWLGKNQQPPLPVVFVTMPDDDFQPAQLQRCFIDELVKIIREHADSKAAVSSELVEFQTQRTVFQLMKNSHKVSPLFDYSLSNLQHSLGKSYKDYGLKVFIGEQLDTLPSTELSHLSPLFPLLSGDTPDRRFVWAFTLSKAPPALASLDFSQLGPNEANRAARRAMEQYLSSVWLSQAFNSEKLSALYSRLVSTVMIPSAAALDMPQCVKGA